jgi:hypothetical protein
MRLPRVRIWLVMLAVAIVAVGSATWVLWKRSAEYARLATQCETHEFNFRLDLEHFESLKRFNQEEIESLRETLPGLDGDSFEVVQRQIKEAQDEIQEFDDLSRACSQHVAAAHANVAVCRRSVRFPWLGAPRVKKYVWR